MWIPYVLFALFVIGFILTITKKRKSRPGQGGSGSGDKDDFKLDKPKDETKF